MTRKAEIDWDQVRREKHDGASAQSLADKCGVHVSSIYSHLNNGQKSAGGGQNKTSQKSRRRCERREWKRQRRQHCRSTGRLAAAA